MNNPEGIAKETFLGVFTYDETFETVQMDGYGDVLKLTAADKEMVLSVLVEYEKLSNEHKAMMENYKKLEVCLQKVGVILE